jgi:hypothetical protein
MYSFTGLNNVQDISTNYAELLCYNNLYFPLVPLYYAIHIRLIPFSIIIIIIIIICAVIHVTILILHSRVLLENLTVTHLVKKNSPSEPAD